jgi:hypothetical protein
MKQVLALAAVVALLLPCCPTIARGNTLPLPPIPQRHQEVRDTSESLPVYAIAGGVVALTMAGTFAALVYIRKRNGK